MGAGWDGSSIFHRPVCSCGSKHPLPIEVVCWRPQPARWAGSGHGPLGGLGMVTVLQDFSCEAPAGLAPGAGLGAPLRLARGSERGEWAPGDLLFLFWGPEGPLRKGQAQTPRGASANNVVVTGSPKALGLTVKAPQLTPRPLGALPGAGLRRRAGEPRPAASGPGLRAQTPAVPAGTAAGGRRESRGRSGDRTWHGEERSGPSWRVQTTGHGEGPGFPSGVRGRSPGPGGQEPVFVPERSRQQGSSPVRQGC